MIDDDGYRLGIGIILVNEQRRVFWGKRIDQKHAWQFPQGGIQQQETLIQALYRELMEEIGLTSADVAILASTRAWLRYQLPKKFIRYYSKPVCVGQKQKWFLLRLLADEKRLCLTHSPNPEFERYRWVHYWRPVREVISFKRYVYKRALEEFAPFIDAKVFFQRD